MMVRWAMTSGPVWPTSSPTRHALAAFDARTEIGVLGVPGRADTVEELSELMRSRGVRPLRWYGVWLFVDWLEFSGAELDPAIRSR
jgi:hypothetical protein